MGPRRGLLSSVIKPRALAHLLKRKRSHQQGWVACMGKAVSLQYSPPRKIRLTAGSGTPSVGRQKLAFDNVGVQGSPTQLHQRLEYQTQQSPSSRRQARVPHWQQSCTLLRPTENGARQARPLGSALPTVKRAQKRLGYSVVCSCSLFSASRQRPQNREIRSNTDEVSVL